jgi:uracil-DNA glycosylase family 4
LDSSKLGRMEAWFRYSEDLGLGPFYRDRAATHAGHGAARSVTQSEPVVTAAGSESVARTMRASAGASRRQSTADAVAPKPPAVPSMIQAATSPSLFDKRIEGDTLDLIRDAIGANCTRCKLHKGRTKIVYGVGNPKAELVFVGEGPGHDEDIKGEPFVGRAGKLLTQMIEAMGLRREDVYICNVVKCRPPENRLPEKDEITTCSPFLMRQLDAIQPKVICGLGSCASQTLLQTTQGISRFRGEWFDFRGSKFIATYHPAYLLRNPSAKGEVWKDLQKVMAVLGLKPKGK